jgi:glucose/arabinose dehydrogenase/mono/diheme cytochrome c family protein
MFEFLKYYKKNLIGVWVAVFSVTGVLLSAYTGTNKVVSAQVDSLDLRQFVEPGFPFISASIDARKAGRDFPADNMAARTLALQLGDSAYVGFDTDLLRWSVAWTGHFLPMVLMAQISYKDFFNKNNKISTVTGDPQVATGMYQGWSTDRPVFEDIRPRPADPRQVSWGALPAETGRWKGVFVYGEKAILNYTVGSAEVYEMPGSLKFEGQTVFTRTIQINQATKDLYLTAAEVKNGKKTEVRNGFTYIYQGANLDTVTAVGVLGKRHAGWEGLVSDNRFLTVRADVSAKPTTATVVVWKGPARLRTAFEKLCKKTTLKFPDFQNGGPAHWKETVVTKGKLSPDTAAYVTDQLTLPLPNPWKRNVRVADVSFFKDGRAAAVTFDGDVWTLEGIDRNLDNIRWKRVASGLFEPMSVEVIDEKIYVFGREGIVRLNDLNGDGVTDFYENFSNIMTQSAESREWAADMVHAPDGSFYVAKGGSLSNGPGMTPQVAKGFRAGSRDNGTILKISADGRQYETIATGLRGPFLGMHPEKGILTASDQQGNFVPSSPIYLIKKGDYYGVPATAHGNERAKVTPPLTWIPHNVDRSSLGQAWVTGNRMGPISGGLIHFSFSRPGLFRVLMDSSSSIVQGGLSFIGADYPAPTSKGNVNPKDGQMYIAGFNLWGSSSTGVSALMRLRYTGKPSYMPNQFHAGTQGIILGFDSELGPDFDPGNFAVKRWNYKRTEEYGSGHFKMDGTSGQETLPVQASYLSADRKKVFLLVRDMKEVMQMEVEYHLTARDGKNMNDHFYFTVNNASDLNLTKEGFGNVDLAKLSASNKEVTKTAELEKPVSVERGKALFQGMACAGCHSEGLKTAGMYGPPFQKLYNSERVFEDGSKAIADDKYIRESILKPAVKVVKGYGAEMPSFVGILSDGDIESITMYIKSLARK